MLTGCTPCPPSTGSSTRCDARTERDFHAIPSPAGIAGIGFVVILISANLIMTAGVCVCLRRDERSRTDPWSLVGLTGVLMQSVVFTSVEATRLALTSAAEHDAGGVAGLWSLYTALFGFNQVFLATALLGLSMFGIRNGAIARWHAGTGFLAATLLFATATTSPYGIDGVNPLALLGLAGWLLWLVWILAYSIILIRKTPQLSAQQAPPRSPQPSTHGNAAARQQS
jgi:hypothetical protein